jgi:RNA polymerase sigma factor for flagellar operon FliA
MHNQKETTTMIQTTETDPACERGARLREHRPLVSNIARRLLKRLPPHVGVDDLMQAGMIGLLEAMRGFDQRRGASFGTYASRRIEGAMLDQLRATDTLSRGVRAQQRKIRAAMHRLEQKLGRPARAKEVADELGWPLATFHRCMETVGAGTLRAGDRPFEVLEDKSPAVDRTDTDDFAVDECADPLRILQGRERLAALGQAFGQLADREQHIVEMIFVRGLRLDEVGAALGVSASRICQIRQHAVAKLRKQLATH